MFSVRFPDWKKVGKKLRDILNPPVDTGPSREERRARRLRDGLKGFVYLDDFDELKAWSQEDIDPIQRANTPLMKRSASAWSASLHTCDKLIKLKYGVGGYHDYEGIRPSLVEDSLYSCNYLQYVDTFVYFSHKLVCVPPPTWTNTMHRNGVKILGTVILESDKIHSERMLDQKDGEFAVAKQLATIADAYGFDGWLLNVEIEFPKIVKDSTGKLTGFIRNLKRLLGAEGLVIWYDALNTDNRVDYQNGLTEKNATFALAADSLFTNYTWTKAKLEQAKIISQWHGILPKEVQFGIDVWAQNTDMLGPPRVTFPAKGGGGTNTGLGLKTLAESGFSAAVFGPGWTHEHFPVSSANGKSIAQSVERSVWEGTLLPDELDCDCRKGRPHHTQDYEMNPVVKFAREFPVGSPSFFYTNFRGAFELSANPEDAKFQPRPGSQAVLPHLLPFPAPPNMFVYAELPVKASQGLMIKVKLPSVPKEDALVVSKLNRPPGEVLRLCLYKLNMPANASLDATFDFTAMPTRGQSTIGFYTAYKMPMASTIEFQDSIIWYPYPGKTEHKTVEIKSEIAGSRLVELGVFCAGHNGMVKHDKLFRVSSVTVKPKLQPDVSWSIGSVQVLKREHVEGVQRRLVWTWNGSNDSRPNGSPWSRVTGPFSHFVVVFGGEEFGEVYCHEFPLQNSDFDMCEAEGDMEAVIRGILFDGGEVSSLPVIIKKCQAINV